MTPTEVILKLIFNSTDGIKDIKAAKAALDELTKSDKANSIVMTENTTAVKSNSDAITKLTASLLTAKKSTDDNTKSNKENKASIEDLADSLRKGTMALGAFYAALKLISTDNSFVETSSQYEVNL